MDSKIVNKDCYIIVAMSSTEDKSMNQRMPAAVTRLITISL